MKKRSLFAAVAMLIVSAIVLTSSTYAWFKGTSSVSVPTIAASVSGSDGTLLLSADGGQHWDISFQESDIADLVKPALGVLTPISVTPDTSNLTAMSGALANGTAFSGADITSSFTGGIKYSYMIKATVDCTVNVTPTFTSGVDFGYCYVVTNNGASGTDNQVLSKLMGRAASRTYSPIANANSVSGTDANGNGIMETGEGVNLAATQTTEASAVAMAVNAKANTPITVYVWMWAEGNDAACTGTASGAPSIAFTVAKGS